MTAKQEITIRYIEHMLEIKYEGKNDSDAWKFIHDNLKFAKKCSYFESQMSMPVSSTTLGMDKETDFDLERDLSRELLIRDAQHGVSKDKAMEHFAENLFLENTCE